MADYPKAAERLKANADIQFQHSSFTQPQNFTYENSSMETAAEDVAVGVLVGYTALADTRMCNSVKVWKIVDDWSALDADFRVTLTTGGATRSLSLKVVLTVSPGKKTWALDLFDWDTAGGKALSYTGTIQAVVAGPDDPVQGDMFIFTFDRSSSTEPLPQRHRRPPRQRTG